MRRTSLVSNSLRTFASSSKMRRGGGGERKGEGRGGCRKKV
jgi:hypothetical protein